MQKVIFYFSLFISIGVFGQNNSRIEGRVVDSKTGSPLPFTSIAVKNSHVGTVSNEQGYFTLIVPDSLYSDSFQVNYLGYLPYEKPIADLGKRNLKIKLTAVPKEIKEVVVRPLTPDEVLDRVLLYFDENYPQSSFISNGFYLQELVENDTYVDFIEAYVDLYSPAYNDTGKCMARLLQGRTHDDLGEIQFLKKFAEKKHGKKVRKAKRKGDSIPSDDNIGVVVNFGGPRSIASDDNIRSIATMIDAKSRRKFDFQLLPVTHLGGRELYVLKCKSKRRFDNTFIDATLYIDAQSFAVAAIKADVDVEVPLIAKPFVTLYRIKLNDLSFRKDIEYRMVDSTWYPHKILTDIYIDVQKKYSGKYREHSVATLRKAFAVTDIQTDNAKPFPAEEQISEEPLAKQLGEYDPEFWENKNKIVYTQN